MKLIKTRLTYHSNCKMKQLLGMENVFSKLTVYCKLELPFSH